MSEAYPFPFFGAGEAGYFEFMAMALMFKRKPKAEQQAVIKACAPQPFKEGLLTYSSKVLMVEPDDYIHVMVSSAYDADPGDEDDLDGRPIFAADSKMRRFNEDIERWLLEVHEIAPLAFAVRGTDGEAGGTEFSVWHEWSMAEMLTPTLESFRKTIAKPSRRAKAALLLEQVLWLARESDVALPVEFVRWLEPELAVRDAILTGDPEQVAASLEAAEDEHELVRSALGGLEFTPEARKALRAVESALIHVDEGWGAVLAAHVLDAEDAAAEPEVTRVMKAGPGREPAHSGFTLASTVVQGQYELQVLEAGARLCDHPFLVGSYLGAAARAVRPAHPDVMRKAEGMLDQPLMVMNLTALAYNEGLIEWGLEVAAKGREAGGLQKWSFLNVALLHACNGDAAQARTAAKQAADADDESAPMIEPAALVAEGKLDEAVAELKRLAAKGIRGFRKWRDDRAYAALFDRPDYQALFD